MEIHLSMNARHRADIILNAPPHLSGPRSNCTGLDVASGATSRVAPVQRRPVERMHPKHFNIGKSSRVCGALVSGILAASNGKLDTS